MYINRVLLCAIFQLLKQLVYSMIVLWLMQRYYFDTDLSFKIILVYNLYDLYLCLENLYIPLVQNKHTDNTCNK